MSILDYDTEVINKGTPFERVAVVTPTPKVTELQNRIKDLRTYYANKKRKTTVTLVGKPYERDHFQGKILVQDYKLSTGNRVYCEFVTL